MMKVYRWTTRFRGVSYVCVCSEDRQHRSMKEVNDAGLLVGWAELCQVLNYDYREDGWTLVSADVAPMGMEHLCLKELEV